MTILVDIDSTITNFGEALLQANNNEYDTNYTYNQITSYDWFDKTFEDPWFLTTRHYFWNKVQVNPEAVTTLEDWVKQGYKVYLVTASHFSDTLGRKICKTLEPFNSDLINERNIIVAQDKSIIKGDVMIDDCIDNLNSSSAFPICFAQPWNKEYLGDRTSSWEEIKEIVDTVNFYMKYFK